MIGVFLNIHALQYQSDTVCFDTILISNELYMIEIVIISKCPTLLRIVGQIKFKSTCT